jgi:Xaa-Pro aminopeptidase
MKTDLDSLMQARQIDAILVTGPAQHNPPMVYLTGGAHLTNADLIKKRGEPPVLFFNPMERDEAARTGLPRRSLAEYRLVDLMKENNGSLQQALVARYQRMLADTGVTSGQVAIYGQQDAGLTYGIFSALQQAVPELTITGELENSVFLDAMSTKDPAEVERIRRMGRVTTAVVGQVADFLTSQRVQDGSLVKADGTPVTIGDVKSRINLWLAERGADNPEGTIFSIGKDAGVPHSTGNPADPMRLGETIVFDIFPCEAGGGYFYDFTRTWCLGYAPDPALALYEDVLAVYRQIMSELRTGSLCRDFQRRTCELFEERGHPTVLSNPQTETGYVHSLGHGLGLHVHERPWFGERAGEGDRLDPGVVVTIEPGLYYPERGLGVRLEDTVWARPDGQMEILAEYPLDLVLPVKS